jgi:hypothetical protein
METSFLAGVFFLAVSTAGGAPTDLVSLIDGPDYFKARSIEVSADKMAELAGKGPSEGQTSVAQLLAIRWLGEHPAEAKQVRGAREGLQKIAEGDRAKDPQGFARDYARRALARLDGKAAPAPTMPANSVRDEALRWFPAPSTIFGGLEFRPPRGVKVEEDPMLWATMANLIPARERTEMYKFADQVGNIRLDRVSFAVIPDPDQDQRTRLFIRYTGRGDRKRLAEFLRQNMGDAALKEQKSDDDKPISIVNTKRGGPAIAIVGDTDLIMAGYPGAHGPQQPARDVEVVEEALQVMAGKKPSIVKGSYAGTLRNSPAQAVGLAVGNLPQKWRDELTGKGSPFRGFPQDFNVTLTRSTKGASVSFTGAAATAGEAKAFVESVNTLKQQAAEGLKKLPPVIKLSAKAVDAMQTALKSIKVEARDALLTGSATIPDEAIRAAGQVMNLALVPRKLEGPRPPQPDRQ